MSTIVGIDLGSARVGLVAAHGELPLRRVVSDTLRVDRKDLGATVAAIVERVCPGATRAVLEHAPFFAPVNKGPGALAAMAQNHEIAAILHDRLERELRARGVEVETIPRATWAHRVVPHTKGGITDEMANTALSASFVAPEAWSTLQTQDERDAAGAIVAALFPRPKRPGKYRYRDRRKDKNKPRAEVPAMTAEQKVARRRIQQRDSHRKIRGSLTPEQRAAIGCSCVGSHRKGCPVYEAKAPERDAKRAARAAAERARIAAGVANLRAARERVYR